jgi:hypothetical protein
MDRIKSFENFINEEVGMGIIAQSLGQMEKSALAKEAADRAAKDAQQSASAASDASIAAYNSGSSSLSTAFNAIPGNDDFTLYMQHQQGVAGAAGILKALNGTGKMAGDTIKTKAGVKYANLVKNIPSDKPDVKRNVIAALDKGDQKTAAKLFLETWKSKFASKKEEAKKLIDKPDYAKVKDAISAASSKNSVPFDFAITVANIESGLRPGSGNSTYKGLFALVPSSNYGGSITPIGSKWNDPYINADAGTKVIKDSIKLLKKQLGTTGWASLNVGDWAKNIA